MRMRPTPATAPKTLPATVPADVAFELELDPNSEPLDEVEDAAEESPVAVLLLPLPPTPKPVAALPPSVPVEVASPVKDESVEEKVEETPSVVVYVSLYRIVPDELGSVDVVRLTVKACIDKVPFEKSEVVDAAVVMCENMD
jgi:hypothetical protein